MATTLRVALSVLVLLLLAVSTTRANHGAGLCTPNACDNSAVCVETSLTQYQCQCRGGTGGARCSDRSKTALPTETLAFRLQVALSFNDLNATLSHTQIDTVITQVSSLATTAALPAPAPHVVALFNWYAMLVVEVYGLPNISAAQATEAMVDSSLGLSSPLTPYTSVLSYTSAYSSVAAAKSSTLTDEQLAVIIVMSIFGACLLVALAFWIRRCILNRKRANETYTKSTRIRTMTAAKRSVHGKNLTGTTRSNAPPLPTTPRPSSRPNLLAGQSQNGNLQTVDNSRRGTELLHKQPSSFSLNRSYHKLETIVVPKDDHDPTTANNNISNESPKSAYRRHEQSRGSFYEDLPEVPRAGSEYLALDVEKRRSADLLNSSSGNTAGGANEEEVKKLYAPLPKKTSQSQSIGYQNGRVPRASMTSQSNNSNDFGEYYDPAAASVGRSPSKSNPPLPPRLTPKERVAYRRSFHEKDAPREDDDEAASN